MTFILMKMNKLTTFTVFGVVLMVHWSEATPPADWKFYRNNMTPYRFVANNDTSPPKFDGCRPKQFWGMFRHGTRNPKEKFVEWAKEVLLPLRDTIVANHSGMRLSQSEISLFKNWELGIKDKDILMLTEEGARELQQLGKRFKSRFPELFAKKYDKSTFEFYHTTSVRTKDSASNFTVGLFGEESQSKIKFSDQAKSDSILKVLEYIKDMNHYAKHGYLVEVTCKMMCPLVKNVFNFFKSGSTKSSVKIHFAHSNTMMKFYAILGLFKDPRHLKASNFASSLNRQWKGRVIDSFAANIVFVLYDCGGKKEVLTLHNEKPITLPGCPKTLALCPLTTILAIYSDSLNNCDISSICFHDDSLKDNYLRG